MDLLLYLVRKEEVDIYDIPIARITEQYLRYIEMLKQFDIDMAGDFLVLAATLMQVKSAMLLPQADPDQLQAQELIDPRTELIRQLLEYKKFKDAANLLNAAAGEQSERFSRPSSIIDKLKPDAEPQVDIENVSIWGLLEAFDAIMAATGVDVDIRHIADDTPIDIYQVEILKRLQTEGQLGFERIFESRKNRVVIVGVFLALLELVRSRLVSVEQQGSSEGPGSLYLRALTDEPAETAVQNAILAAVAETAAQPPAADENTPPVADADTPQPAPERAGVDDTESVEGQEQTPN